MKKLTIILIFIFGLISNFVIFADVDSVKIERND